MKQIHDKRQDDSVSVLINSEPARNLDAFIHIYPVPEIIVVNWVGDTDSPKATYRFSIDLSEHTTPGKYDLAESNEVFVAFFTTAVPSMKSEAQGGSQLSKKSTRAEVEQGELELIELTPSRFRANLNFTFAAAVTLTVSAQLDFERISSPG